MCVFVFACMMRNMLKMNNRCCDAECRYLNSRLGWPRPRTEGGVDEGKDDEGDEGEMRRRC